MRVISSSPAEPGGAILGAGPRPQAAVRRPSAWYARLKWPCPPAVLDAAWAVFAVANLVAIFAFPGWETIPFHLVWASLTLVLAAMFLAMAWRARRKQAAERSHRLISEQNASLLATQRQFLQDAAHQLRTPITIALGHAELLAGDLTGQQEGQDIRVVIGELSRLRRISERLLVIAAAADPAFLHAELVALDRLTMELVRRWRPAADRCWQLGRLDQVTVRADRERLSLALDALLENAVRHTGTADVIQLSVIRGWPGMPARIVVADSGSGIAPDQLHLIFDRFRTGDDGQPRGTGLGLPLVRAVARAHGGDVTVRSVPGQGSEFELTLPEPASCRPELPAAAAGAPRVPVTAVAPGPAAQEADQDLPAPAIASRGDGAAREYQAMSEQGAALPWRALRWAGRIVVRNKIATAATAVFLVAAVAISVAGTRSSGSSPQPDPVAPGFTLTALGDPGHHITLSQYAGKPLIVNFWASWCPPCQQETPLLARWYAGQHGHVILVGLDENDNAASALKFARAKGVTYPIGTDPQLAAANAYGVVALPQTFFLNAQHRIVDRVYGAVTLADLAKGVRLMDAPGS